MTNGQQLVAYYVDECEAQGHLEMVRMRGQVALHAKRLFDAIVAHEGLSEAEAIATVEAALREFVRRRSRTGLALAEISVELAREGGAVAERPSARKKTQDWINENGWPTGARFSRGSIGGTYVYDPLGTEKIPPYYEGWPHPRPSFDDVLAELDRQGLLGP